MTEAALLAAQAAHREGLRLWRQGARAAAIAKLRAAALPEWPEALADLGHALREEGQPEAAIDCYRAALARNPRQARLHLDLGTVLRAIGQDGAARDSFTRAIALDPSLAAAHAGAARVLSEANRHVEALDGFNRAALLELGNPLHRWNAALSRLALGDYRGGWRDFEARWKLDVYAAAKRRFAAPRWTGAEDLTGRTVLLWAEQGFGDTFQFVRYAPLVAARGARVVLEAPAPTLRLLARTQGVAAVVARGEALPPYDLHCPLMSLPLAFATTLDTVPAPIPYLHPDPAEVAAWRERLAGVAGLKVGLVWAGSPRPQNPVAFRTDQRRSLDPALLAGLAKVPGVAWVSLQKDPVRRAPDMMMRYDWTVELTDFAATAALVRALDLVISVDTAVAHLAGGVGVPVWLLNRFDTCWRWLLRRDDSPWYPTLRQFRQPAPGDWDSVLRRVADALHTPEPLEKA